MYIHLYIDTYIQIHIHNNTPISTHTYVCVYTERAYGQRDRCGISGAPELVACRAAALATSKPPAPGRSSEPSTAVLSQQQGRAVLKCGWEVRP